MGKKQKEQNKKNKQIDQFQENDLHYQSISSGARKSINHIVERKQKRTKSFVKMKPLKKRQNNLGLPDYCPKGYTQQQFQLYKQEYSRIFELNRDDLREILKLNKQDASPLMKAELLHRCADGYALGRVPICPHCFGMTPIYDKNKGSYFCPGYREGEQFITCESNFQKDDLPRIKPWNTNFEQRQRVRIHRTEEKLRKQRQYQTLYKINKRKRLAQGQEGEEDESDCEENQNIVKEKKQHNQTVKRQAEGRSDINQQGEVKKQQINDA